MQNGDSRRVFKLLTAGLLSVLLMLPTIVKFVHDFLEHHVHEICAAELEGEVHYHAVDQECHYHPLFLSSYHAGDPAPLADIGLDEPVYTDVIPLFVCKDQPLVVSLRGPPAA